MTESSHAKEVLPEDQVHLKPILGIRPGIYLTILYSLILLTVLFLLLLYPGLSRPGRVLQVLSEPAGAAVQVDGVYWGTTPGDIFIPQGDHQLEMTLPGFNTWHKELRIQGRVFGLFPQREPLSGILDAPDLVAAFALEAADYAGWSLTGEPTVTYQVPLSLSEGAYRSGPGALNPETYTALEALVKGSARFASTRAAMRDLIRTKYITDNGGLSSSPVTLLRSAEDMLAYLSTTPGSAAWLVEVLPTEAVSLITGSPWYMKQTVAALSQSITPSLGGVINLESLSFRAIPGGTLVQDNSFPHSITVEDFYMCETEVSLPSWEAFVQANPAWGVEHTDELTAQGLVTGDYRVSQADPRADSVPGVSWYGAAAYCQWLNRLLPANMAAWEVRLPTEAEWEYAAKAVLNAGDSRETLRDMLGGLWEWCTDPYAPFNFLPADAQTISAIGSPERVVRGGSWVNPPGSVRAETRGSLPPVSCSPFVSFRPVIALKGATHE
ncbi:MAG: SUMF1/EgtB/PvdO family nonheme iron enzyme [Treponema sp.]|jgi:hypothetical protein|nr:SUMF1/EgtB/PvdO family nonheme iron enzyme [Treponema sp.]